MNICYVRPLQYDEIMPWQHLPLEQAAERCGLRATAFKKQCRRVGIKKWPYRQEKSRMKMEERMSVAVPVDPLVTDLQFLLAHICMTAH